MANPSTNEQVRDLSSGVGARRVQRKRSKGWTRGNAICVNRSSRYGNPFAVYRDRDGWRIHVLYVTDGRFPKLPAFDSKHEATVAAVELFAAWLKGDLFVAGIEVRRKRILDGLEGLRGRDLACYCGLPAEGDVDHCHARVLLELAAEADGGSDV